VKAMASSVIEELRLTDFKSFHNAVLPLDELTLIVGRNGSGKSNALDGLWALGRLAEGEEIRDALDGGSAGPAVRGGAAGCAPFGTSSFSLGCKVRTGETTVDLDVTVQTEPVVQVVSERLASDGRELLATEAPREDSSDITASWASGARGVSPRLNFRAGRMLATQVLARVPATSAGRKIHLAAAQVLAALRAVFVLDPVPHLMRQYVPRRDILLRRNADNLSAAVASLLEQEATRERLRLAVERLNEQEVVNVITSKSELDDVMLTLIETFEGRDYPVPARIMSDGTLRFLAILTALMQAPALDNTLEHLAAEDAVGQRTVVVEEIEDFLYASQASMLIDLLRDEVKGRRVRVLATAHSPALLDALSGEEHRSVIVCQRDPKGLSTLTRLVDLPNYVDILSQGSLGRAAVKGQLRREETQPNPIALLDRLFGRQTS
jgi:predicted ATPase